MSRTAHPRADTEARKTRDARIVEIAKANPEMARKDIAKRMGCGVGLVVAALRAAGVYESRSRKTVQ